MKIEIDFKFGQVVYLKNDPEQLEFLITRFIILQKNILLLELFTPQGEYIEVWDGLVTTERDKLKMLAIEGDGETVE